jgi:DNA-binding PadR family transcriptional regulator
MNQVKAKTRNLWELTVLCLLRLRPMHPYELQRLIREWHKDAFLELKRGSLYHAIERLRRAGCIEARETTREGRRPERTVYRLTEAGENAGIEWLRELLAKPVPEPTQFFAALSFLPHLTPAIVMEQLKERMGLLELEIASLRTVLETMTPRIGRLVLIEVEYLKAMRQADLEWVKSFLEELHAGRLVWDPQLLAQVGAAAADKSSC